MWSGICWLALLHLGKRGSDEGFVGCGPHMCVLGVPYTYFFALIIIALIIFY